MKYCREQMENEVTRILTAAVGEYAESILDQVDGITGNSFKEDVIQVLEESSCENEDDIRLAIGKELMARLGV